MKFLVNFASYDDNFGGYYNFGSDDDDFASSEKYYDIFGKYDYFKNVMIIL